MATIVGSLHEFLRGKRLIEPRDQFLFDLLSFFSTM
jgi:hypothetical protein